MSASRHAGAPHDNILARLERGRHGARSRWSPANKAAAGASLLFALLVLSLIVWLGQDRQQVHRPAEVALAVPAPVVSVAAAPESALLGADLPPPILAPTPAPAAVTTIPPAAAPKPVQRPAAPSPARGLRTAKVMPLRTLPPLTGRSTLPSAPRSPTKVDGDAGIDNDVALLSAILLHTPRHSAERAKAERRCNGDKTCLAAMSVQLTD